MKTFSFNEKRESSKENFFLVYQIWHHSFFTRNAKKARLQHCVAGNSERKTLTNKFCQFVKILSRFIFFWRFLFLFVFLTLHLPAQKNAKMNLNIESRESKAYKAKL